MSEVDFQQMIWQIASGFRLGLEGQGSERLVIFIEALMPRLQDLPPDATNELNGYLSQTMAALERRDYIYAADMLEFPVSDLLKKIGL